MAGIEKVATVVRMGDPDPDAGFWLSRPPVERVAHLRELQAYYYGPDAADGGGLVPLGKDLQDFVELCLERGVRFLVVGGYAVVAHGHPRLTKDLDIWVWVESRNAARIADVLAEFGFGSLGLSAEDFAVAGPGVQLGRPPNRIDILTSIPGVDFESCWERREGFPLGSVTVPFIGLEDLERNKLAAGRHQDLADVEALRRNRSARWAPGRGDDPYSNANP